MKTIKEYIQFAINNGYPIYSLWKEIEKVYKNNMWFLSVRIVRLYWNMEVRFSISLYELITSKPFIESIARWLYENWIQINSTWLSIDTIIETSIWESFYKKDWTKYISRLENRITTEQAIAIRDWKLEEFITKLWIWKQ